jgi:hypothetical protein
MASKGTLTQLPPELILIISDYLPPDGILALTLTLRRFNSLLPVVPRLRNTTLTECARLAMRTYLSPSHPQPSHLRCILCKIVYPASMFSSLSSPACVPISFAEGTQQTEIIELPERLCSWHVGRLSRVIHTEAGGRNEWVCHMDNMCMHCGAVQRWDKCDCKCDSCSFRIVKVYTRYLNNETQCRRFVFWRNSQVGDALPSSTSQDDNLWVREICWDRSK